MRGGEPITVTDEVAIVIHVTAVSAAMALWAAADAPIPRECVWEAPGRARVTITYYQNDGRYLRYNDVRVEILDRKGVVARSPESRHGRYWFIFARDSAGELVAEDDYVPPPVNLPPKDSKAETSLPPYLRRWVAGAMLEERVDWDSSLLPGQQWKADEHYRIRPANGLSAHSDDASKTRVIPVAIDKCLIPDARVVVGAAGARNGLP